MTADDAGDVISGGIDMATPWLMASGHPVAWGVVGINAILSMFDDD